MKSVNVNDPPAALPSLTRTAAAKVLFGSATLNIARRSSCSSARSPAAAAAAAAVIRVLLLDLRIGISKGVGRCVAGPNERVGHVVGIRGARRRARAVPVQAHTRLQTGPGSCN